MSATDNAAAAPIAAVLFDFHATLPGFGDPRGWLTRAWAHAGRRGTPEKVLGEGQVHRLSRLIRGMRDDLREVAPADAAAMSAERHRAVFRELAVRLEWIDDDLAQAMYDTLMEAFIPYDDAVPTLIALREHGIVTGLVSNIEIDVRPMLAGMDLAHLFDVVVRAADASGEVAEGAGIAEAVRSLGADPARTLVVGDDWTVGRAAAAAGVIALVVPPAPGPRHGLDLLVRMVG